MTRAAVPSEALKTLPTSVWVPGSDSVDVYHGTPIEIVRAMAAEVTDADLSVPDAVQTLLNRIAHKRGVLLAFPPGCGEETLAGLFIYALLNTGIGREVPSA